MALVLNDLMAMSQSQLDDLFRASPPGPIPDGDSRGTAIILAGTPLSRLVAGVVRWFFWQGKVFDAPHATLRNKISTFGIRAIRANVYPGQSWLDGKDCIVLDYSKTSFVARKIRDEIRLVAPGVYLGEVYWGKRRVANFVIQFADRTADAAAGPETVATTAQARS